MAATVRWDARQPARAGLFLARTYVASVAAAMAGFVTIHLLRTLAVAVCAGQEPKCLQWGLYAFLGSVVATAIVMTLVGWRLSLPSAQHLAVVGGWLLLAFLYFQGVHGWALLLCGVVWPAVVAPAARRFLSAD